jgi:hypothetical protein
VSRSEFTEGFGRWYSSWSAGHDGGLSEEQLRNGIRTDVLPPAPPSGAKDAAQ